jgi:hypothetical protein
MSLCLYKLIFLILVSVHELWNHSKRTNPNYRSAPNEVVEAIKIKRETVS